MEINKGVSLSIIPKETDSYQTQASRDLLIIRLKPHYNFFPQREEIIL